MSTRSHKFIHFLDPNSKTKDTIFRSVLCNKRTIFLEYETQKKRARPRRKNAIDDTIRLGFDFKGFDQGYYTKDKNKVTCKNCKMMMEGKKKSWKLEEDFWNPIFVGTIKAGGWIVVGVDGVQKMFPGASRKNHETAKEMVRKHNQKIISDYNAKRAKG